MNAAQFVEETLLRRLSDNTRDVEKPSDHEFTHLITVLSPLVDKYVGRTNLPGISDDDLRSLYAMKIHQVLRRGKYDRTRKPQPFFHSVLGNFNRDINRLVDYAKRQELDEDGFNYSFSVDTIVTEIYAPEKEKHKLDALMERLNERQRKVIEITLNNLDKDDHTLLPLAKELLDFWG